MSQHDKIAAVFREFDEPPSGTIERDEVSTDTNLLSFTKSAPKSLISTTLQFTLALKLLGFDVNEEPLSEFVEVTRISHSTPHTLCNPKDEPTKISAGLCDGRSNQLQTISHFDEQCTIRAQQGECCREHGRTGSER